MGRKHSNDVAVKPAPPALDRRSLKQVAALAMFSQPYAGSNALFHGLPLSIDGERAGAAEKAPKIGEHDGKI